MSFAPVRLAGLPAARARVLGEARRWIGTPYRHGAALCGAGCDCLGLIRGMRAALGCEAVAVPPYPADWALRGGAESLRRALEAVLPVAEGGFAPGQVLLFRLRPGAPAAHLGIASSPGAAPRFIHAYDRHGVVESPLTPRWAARVVARFELYPFEISAGL